MINHIRGNIVEKQPPIVIIEVNGIGYEIHMPISCFNILPDVNKEVIIFTKFIIRENTQFLFGFNNKEEQILFNELIKINGVGPKLVLTILSSMSVKEFINIIENEEIVLLIKLSGIGKKIANRLIIEMKDRLKFIYEIFSKKNIESTINSSYHTNILNNNSILELEAISALIVLGYKREEAKNMINKVNRSSINDSTMLIRAALRTTI